MLEAVKGGLALFGGVLIASGSECFGQVELIEKSGLSHEHQIVAGVVMFVASMIMHIANGGSILPWND